jgi:hypothetical protein
VRVTAVAALCGVSLIEHPSIRHPQQHIPVARGTFRAKTHQSFPAQFAQTVQDEIPPLSFDPPKVSFADPIVEHLDGLGLSFYWREFRI